MSKFQQVVQTGLWVAFISVACRLVSVVKELVVAAEFGAGVAMDAYGLSMMLPQLAMATLVVAARSAFLTQFGREEDDERRAILVGRFLAGTLLVATAVALAVAVVAWLTVPFWVRGGEATRHQVAVLLPWAALLLVVYAAVAALVAIRNACGDFVKAQATNVIPTIAVLVMVVAWGTRHGALGLIVALLAGSVAQAVTLVFVHRRTASIDGTGAGETARHTFIPINWRWDAFAVDARPLWQFATVVVFLGFTSQVNVMVDRVMASGLPDGSVAILTWSGLARDFVSGALIGGFVSVLLPRFSADVAEGDRREVQQTLRKLSGRGAVLIMPVSVLVGVGGPMLLRGVSLGNLSSEAIAGVAACLAAYGVGFYADLVSNSLFQALLALRRAKVLVWIAVAIGMLGNVLFNWLLIGPLGAWGLALSTSIVGFSTLVANALVLRQDLGNVLDFRRIVGAAIASAASGAAAYWLTRQMETGPAQGAVFGVVFVGCYYLVGIRPHYSISRGWVGDERDG